MKEPKAQGCLFLFLLAAYTATHKPTQQTNTHTLHRYFKAEDGLSLDVGPFTAALVSDSGSELCLHVWLYGCVWLCVAGVMAGAAGAVACVTGCSLPAKPTAQQTSGAAAPGLSFLRRLLFCDCCRCRCCMLLPLLPLYNHITTADCRSLPRAVLRLFWASQQQTCSSWPPVP